MEPLTYIASDIGEMASAFKNWQVDIVQHGSGNFKGKLQWLSQLGEKVCFCSTKIDRRVFCKGHHLKDSIMFTFIESPTNCTWNGEKVHPEKLFISDSERGFDLDAGDGFVSFSVSVDRILLEKWFFEEGLGIPGNWNFYMDFRKSNKAGAALVFRQIISNAVHLGIFSLPVFKSSLFRIIDPMNKSYLNRISINFTTIHQTLEMIHETSRNGRETNLQEVLDFYGGPMRTFYYNFKKYTGFTPHQYLKNLRLSAVQTALKRSDPEVTGVREIAYQYGFRHLGQFAKDYRNLFDEMPSHRLKKSNKRGFAKVT